MTTLCRLCRANDGTVEGFCAPCWRDRLAAMRERREAEEQARIGRRRAGSRAPTWRPDHGDRGHGLGRGRNCGEIEWAE